MGYTSESKNRRWGLPVGLLALILMMVLIGTATAPTPAMAAAISCGGCHSTPPKDSDSGGCKQTTKSHPAHSNGADLTTCDRCHPTTSSSVPTAKHNNNIVNITSVVSPGLSYSSLSGTCTNACHKNEPNPTWGGSGADCNLCHFRSGAVGSYTMSGLHAAPGRTYMHFSSAIKVTDNTKTITCVNCHPAVPFANNTTSPRPHIRLPNTAANFKARADMSQAHAYVSVTGIGYVKGATPALGTCALSCHNNSGDTFGNYTIYFKPGQTKRFGVYQTAAWGDTDLKCNECHSTPSQSATFGGSSTTNANKRHKAHMFNYKLNPWNFSGQDRNIYCDDCHRTPDINATRGFEHHSTIGQGGSGVISLPVKSQNARVYLGWRNNNVGRDGINPPNFDKSTATCSNIYCHTIMTSAQWTEQSCNSCHGTKDGINVGSGAPGYRDFTSISLAQYRTFEDYSGGGGAHYTHVTKRGYACHTCHYDGGGDGNAANHHNNSLTVSRANVNVGVEPKWWFNNMTSKYDKVTRSCSDVACHFGASQNWDCTPLH